MTMVDIMDRTSELIYAGNAIYAARQSGLYRFDSPGENPQNLFESWLPDETIPALAITTDGNDLLLAGINGGVARSEDRGGSWEAIQFRPPAPLVTCLVAGDGCVLAGTFEDGVFRSTDGGKSWRVCNHGLFDHSIFCLALSPDFAEDGIAFAGTGSDLYRSENAGRLWRDLTMPASDEAVLCLALSADFAIDRIIFAGTEGHGLLRSGDAGETWATVLETEGAVNSIVLAENRIVVQIDDAAHQSSDGGANWTQLVASDVECLTIDDGREGLLLSMTDGIIRRESL